MFDASLTCAWLLCLALLCGACQRSSDVPVNTMPSRDINAVLEAHDDQLMATPGVVGVYVGLLEDDETACLKVMVVKHTPELERSIPKSIEGYPVRVEETGVIRPMESQQ